MYYQDIECCTSTIFSFFNIQELCRHKLGIWNKCIQHSIDYNISHKIRQTLLYNKILNPYLSKINLKNTPIIFFSVLEKYIKHHTYTKFNLKTILMHIFDKLKKDMNNPIDQFYLCTRKQHLYMVKKLCKHEIVLLIQPNIQCIYYTKLHSFPPNTIQNNNTSFGYLYKNETYQKDSDFIQNLINPTLA